jgi:hypothetical protein
MESKMPNDFKHPDQEERLDGFMQELRALANRYDMGIGGCGCDGSPWVTDYKHQEDVAVNVNIDPERITIRYIHEHIHVWGEWENIITLGFLQGRKCAECGDVERRTI